MVISLSDLRQSLADDGVTSLIGVNVQISDSEAVIKELERKHPTWERKSPYWERALDVAYGESEEVVEKYLPIGDAETVSDFAKRKCLARFKSESVPVAERLVGAVFDATPTRDQQIDAQFDNFLKNSDGLHTSLNEFMEERLFESLFMGAAPFIVDRPSVDKLGVEVGNTSKGFETVPLTRKVSKEEVSLTPYTISQITNWELDRSGEFNWLRIHEQDNLGGIHVDVYREWDRRSWRIFHVYVEGDGRSGKKVVVLHSMGDHFLGMVPIVILYLRKRRPMEFLASMRFAVEHDLDNFRNDSDLQYASWKHGMPTVVGHFASEKKRLPIGVNAYVHCNPQEQEKVEYLQLPLVFSELFGKNKDDSMNGLMRSAGVEKSSQSDNLSSMQSGRAKVINFSVNEKRRLVRSAEACEQAERRMFEIIHRWTDDSDEERNPQDRLTDYDITYPRRFAMDTGESLIDQLTLGQEVMKSATWHRKMQVRVADATLGEMPSADREKIIGEIDATPDEDLFPPDPMEIEEMKIEASDMAKKADDVSASAADAADPPLTTRDLGR